ncbi:MAG TPA: hypothetical protein VFU05_08835, partial [Cyclobacteriaceae bacterium]|nr:hypothetical protein [Cyclobacteriaceae bacterium]
LVLIALVVTLAIEVPIDNQVKVWTSSTLPSSWESFRNRFEFFHTVRTFISLASFAFFSAFVIGSAQKMKTK